MRLIQVNFVVDEAKASKLLDLLKTQIRLKAGEHIEVVKNEPVQEGAGTKIRSH